MLIELPEGGGLSGKIFMADYYALSAEQAAANTTVSGVQTAQRGAKLTVGHVVVWEDRSASADDGSYAIRGQRFGAAGNKSGAEFLVNTITAGDQSAPSVAGLSTGGFVVAWTGSDSSGTGIKAQVYDSAGVKSGTEFLVNTTAADAQNGAQVTAVPGLGFVVVWLDHSGAGNAVRGQFYSSSGTKYGNQFTVSASSVEIHSELSVAPLADGNSRIVVSWTQAGGDGSGSAAMARTMNLDGTGVGGAIQLSESVSGDQRDSAVALYAPSKGFVAAYVDDGEGGAIKLRKFSPTGIPLGGDLRVTGEGESGDNPSIVAFPSGMLAVSWTGADGSVRVQMINGSGEFLGEAFAAGTATGPATLIATGTETILALWSDGDIQTRALAPAGPAVSDIVLSDSTLSEGIPANLTVAQLAAAGIGGSSGFTYSLVGDSTSGAFALQGDRLILADPSQIDFETAGQVEVTVRATDSQGRFREETLVLTVADAPETPPGWVVSEPFAPVDSTGPGVPKVAALASGGFVMVYFDSRFTSPTSGESPLRGRIFSDSGEPIGEEFEVEIDQDDNQHPATVAGLADGGFAVMFSDYREGHGDTGAQLRVQLFDSSGLAVSDQIKVATTSAGGQSGTLVGLPSGGFVVTYANGWSGSIPTVSDVKAQIFDSAGNKVGGEIVVPSSHKWQQSDPAVTVLADGGFVIAWQDAWNEAISAQRFDSAGGRIGDSFQVSSSDLSHYDPSIAGLAGGGFVVVWSHGSGFGVPTPNPWDVIGQVFDSAGNKIGGEFLVNADPLGGERFGSVVPLHDGGFLVTWNEFPSTGDNYHGGVTRAQQFDSAGNKVGGEFAVDEGFASGQFYITAATLAWGGIVIAHTDTNSTGVGAMAKIEARLFSPGAIDAMADEVVGSETDGAVGSVFADNGGGADMAPEAATLMVGAVNGSADNVGRTIDLPSGARLTLNADGTFDYDPNHIFDSLAAFGSGGSNTLGHDSFTYRLAGGDTAVVNVIIRGDYSTPHVIQGSAGADTLTGSNGPDSFVLELGGDDSVEAGPGNDNIFFIGSLTGDDRVDGGDGNDTLILQGDYSGGLTLTDNVTRIELISILAGSNTNFGEPGTNRHDYVLTTHDSNFSGAIQVRVNGSALLAGEDFTFDGSAELDSRFVVYGGRGVDTLTGSRNNDIFFLAEERFATGDTVNGGAGYDGMFLRGNYTIDFNSPGYTGLFTNIENLTLTSAMDERYARGGGTEFDYDLILSDAIVKPGETLTVSGALLMANETMILDGSAEVDGLLSLFGGRADDTLKGGGQADVLFGNLGADQLTGNGGANVFRYNAAVESTSGSMDRILDFASGVDKVDLSRVDADSNVAGNQAFGWIGSNAFSGTAGELRAHQDGANWFVEGDTNGDGVADLVIQLTVTGGPLSQGDFLP